MKKLFFSCLAAIAVSGLIAVPAFAFNSQSGMPREPKTIRGICAKASQGVRIPYRGWRTRDRLSFNTCLRRMS